MKKTVGQKAISRILETLEEVPLLSFEVVHEPGKLGLVPNDEDTFEIWLFDDGDEASIYAGNWHGHESDPEQAAYCVLWLLSPYYRIVETYHDEQLLRAQLEIFTAEGWQSTLVMSTFDLGTSWKANRRLTRQQAVLRPPGSFHELVPDAQLDDRELPIPSFLGVLEAHRRGTLPRPGSADARGPVPFRRRRPDHVFSGRT